MSDDVKALVDDIFGGLFGTGLSDSLPRKGETQAQWSKRMDAQIVPPEYDDAFTVVSIGRERWATCNKCGALVYQIAVDKHFKFHEKLEEK